MNSDPFSSRPSRLLLASIAVFMMVSTGHTAISVGGLAVVGYQDDATDSFGTDSFALVATETINAGEVIYITNNGWNNATRQFDGVWVSGDVGSGAENLVKLTVNSTILAGTIIKSTATSASQFTWTTSGSIPMPMGATGSFSDLDLKHDGVGTGSRGDEIYIFQASSSTNPLLNVSSFIYAIDFGDRLHSDIESWYDPQESGWGGNLPDGFVSTNPLLGGSSFTTVDTVSDMEGGYPNDNSAFAQDPTLMRYNGTFGLDLSNLDVVALQNSTGTKEDWLRMINNSAHWDATTSIFDHTNISADYTWGLAFTGVPEPSRALLLMLGTVVGMMRRRRVV